VCLPVYEGVLVSKRVCVCVCVCVCVYVCVRVSVNKKKKRERESENTQIIARPKSRCEHLNVAVCCSCVAVVLQCVAV